MCDSAHTQRTSDKLPQSAFKKLQKKLKRGKEYLIKWADDGQLIVQEKEAGQIPLESEELERERDARQRLEDENQDLRTRLQRLQKERKGFMDVAQQSESRQKRLDAVLEEASALEMERNELEIARGELMDMLDDTQRDKESFQEKLEDQTRQLQKKELEAQQLRRKAELLEKPPEEVAWQYKNDAKGWTNFNPKDSADITDRWKNRQIVFELICEGRSYRIDLEKQEQTNERTRKVRKIRCELGLPAHWNVPYDQGLAMLRDTGAGAQEEVMAKILPTGPTQATLDKLQEVLNDSLLRHDGTSCNCLHGRSQYNLLEAYQVKNLYLWRRYQRCLKNLRDKQEEFKIRAKRIAPDTGPALKSFAEALQVDLGNNERVLLHGPKTLTHAEQIAKEGFDSRVASESNLYGKGTYFAVQTCKAAQYATPNGRKEVEASAQQPGTVILACVAVGDFYEAQGSYSQSRPPQNEKGVPHDSLIAKPGIPSIFGVQSHMEIVTFSPEQQYPEYILRFMERE